MTIIDFTGLSHSVDHCTVWNVCSLLGLGQFVANLSKSIYDESFCSRKAQNTISSPFQVTTGVRHGSILSLLLFDVLVHWVVREAIQFCRFGIQLYGMSNSYLDFAADICLLEDYLNATQKLLSSVKAAASERSLIIKAEKTQALFSKNTPTLRFVEITCLKQ